MATNLDEQIVEAKKNLKSSDATIRQIAGRKLRVLYDLKYGEN